MQLKLQKCYLNDIEVNKKTWHLKSFFYVSMPNAKASIISHNIL